MMYDDVWWCLRNANAGLQHKRCGEFLPKFQTLCTGVGDGNTYPRSTGVAVCSMAANLRVMKSFTRHCESSVTAPCASRCIMVQTGRTILPLISVQIWHKLDKRNPIQEYIKLESCLPAGLCRLSKCRCHCTILHPWSSGANSPQSISYDQIMIREC